VSGLEADLSAGEAQRRQTGSGVGLIAQAVPRLLGTGAVVAKAVGLHDEAEARPVEVDAIAVDHLAGQGRRQPGALRDADDEKGPRPLWVLLDGQRRSDR